MKNLLVGIVFILSISTLRADIPERPVPQRLVNDFAGILNQTEQTNLEKKLTQFAIETSTQIVVVSVQDLDGYDPGDYTFRLGEKWGVGQKSKDNGLVILIKPKTGTESGRVFIATGYGLEATLPDAIVNGTIIDSEMIPYFKQNDYFRGIENGTNVIMDITRGEYTAEYYREHYANEPGGLPFVVILLLLLFVVIPVLRGRKNRFYSPGKNLPMWIALGMMSGGRHRGSFGNFSSGSGGFGGFGGGSFGGGGAGGSW